MVFQLIKRKHFIIIGPYIQIHYLYDKGGFQQVEAELHVLQCALYDTRGKAEVLYNLSKLYTGGIES